MSDKSMGSRQQVYVKTESTAGDVEVWAGTDAVKINAPFMFVKNQLNEPGAYLKTDTRSETVDVPLSIECTVQLGPIHLLGSGTQGAAADIAPVFATAFTQDITEASTVAASPAPDTTSFTLASDKLDVGDIGWIEIENASGVVIESKHFVVLEKDVSDGLTIWPAFTNAPTEGDLVKACVNYTLNMDNTSCVTIAQAGNLHSQIATGAKFSNFEFAFVKGEIGTVTADGFAFDVLKCIETTLDGALDDSQTTLKAALPGIDEDVPLYVDTELIDPTSLSTADFVSFTVVERGYNSTTPAAHDNGAAIGMYTPAITTAGSPILGLKGGVYIEDISGAGVKLKATELSVSIDEKTVPQEFLGDDGLISGYENPEDREIVWTITADLDADTAEAMAQIDNNSGLKVFFQAGGTAGRAIAFYSPSVIFDIPERPESKGEVVRMVITSRRTLSTSAENALRWAM